MAVGKVTTKENILIHLIMRLSEIHALFLLGLVKENETWLVPTPTFSLAKEALKSVGCGQHRAMHGQEQQPGAHNAGPPSAGLGDSSCAVHIACSGLPFAAH